VSVSIWGKRQYLWRIVDQNGETIDVMAQNRRDVPVALRFFRNYSKDAGGVLMNPTGNRNGSCVGSNQQAKRNFLAKTSLGGE